jgi:hypothetical protein
MITPLVSRLPSEDFKAMRFAALLLVTACADPVVEMELVLPNAPNNTSCVTAVEVHANGATYPQVKEDRVISCLDIQPAGTYAGVRDAIRGKFELGVPDTGLASLEIYGWSGVAACKDDMDPFVTPDLMFFGNAEYIGQDTIELPITPNLDCARSQLKVRIVDMFGLLGGATCATASTYADGAASAGLGTLVPKPYGKGVELFGNIDGANTVGNLATFEGYTKIGSKSCLAIDGGSAMGGSTGCVVGGSAVCAGAGETEHVSLSQPILANDANFDNAIAAKFPGIVIGTVWSSGKTPLAGATVEVSATHGKVVYLDPPAMGSTALKVRTEASTGPSGLFMLYADTLVTAKVSAGGTTRSVVLGATDELVAGAMIVMP